MPLMERCRRRLLISHTPHDITGESYEPVMKVNMCSLLESSDRSLTVMPSASNLPKWEKHSLLLSPDILTVQHSEVASRTLLGAILQPHQFLDPVTCTFQADLLVLVRGIGAIVHLEFASQ